MMLTLPPLTAEEAMSVLVGETEMEWIDPETYIERYGHPPSWTVSSYNTSLHLAQIADCQLLCEIYKEFL